MKHTSFVILLPLCHTAWEKSTPSDAGDEYFFPPLSRLNQRRQQPERQRVPHQDLVFTSQTNMDAEQRLWLNANRAKLLQVLNL